MVESELFRSLEGDIEIAVAVTSTARAARSLSQRYRNWKSANGEAAWKTPQILAWDAWLEALWHIAVASGIESRVLLTETQEQELWRQILGADSAAQQTLSVERLAEMAQQAWRSMHQYRIAPEQLRWEAGVDTAAFYRWIQEFDAVCNKQSLLSPALLETVASDWIESSVFDFPKEILLIGFDRITPSHHRLIDKMKARECSVLRVELCPPEAPDPIHPVVCAQTFEEEAGAVARWTRGILLEHPAHRIGIFVPSLEEHRAVLDSVFRRTLVPSSMDIRTPQAPLPYEFSLGTPMGRMGPVRTALLLLDWLDHGLPPENLSWLLVQGRFGGREASTGARARLDRQFRDRKPQLGGPVSLGDFRSWLTKPGQREQRTTLDLSIDRLSIAAQRQDISKPRPYADWAEVVEELLDASDWSLLSPVQSDEYQLLQRWSKLLGEFSSLNSISGPVGFSAAVAMLHHLASNMLFTLESHNAPIQILGIAESAGLVFDSVWWMSAKLGVWPPQGAAQPFLPWSLQRQAHMPYADPTEDQAFALRVTNRILHSGSRVVVSFDLQESDTESASGPTPPPDIAFSPVVREMLTEAPIISVEGCQPEPWRESDGQLRSALEIVEEEPTVPFQARSVRGGVRFLELQAACPFRAFAELRLGANPLEESTLGLSAADQGSAFHRVLQQFWKPGDTRQKLFESSGEELRSELRQCIHDTLQKSMPAAHEPWQLTLLAIEAARIEQRLLEWLEQEKQRSDFTVFKTETTLEHARLNAIEFRCRVDRMDRVEQGLALIDYKTGEVTRQSCESERPDQPQLPAYAVLQQPLDDNETPPVAGIAFARLRAGEVGFVPVYTLQDVFSQQPLKPTDRSLVASPSDLAKRIESWRRILDRLAQDFHSGMATVDPKNPSETCRSCPQALLCRVRETGDLEFGNDDDGDQGGEGFDR